MSHEANELDVGWQQHLYCLQLDVMMVQDLSRPPTLQHLWTVPTIKDMVVKDAPNVKDYIILAQAQLSCFSGIIRSLERGFTCMRPRSWLRK